MRAGFIFNSILLGIALAMDAFSVSVADSLSCPDMKRSKRFLIPAVFALFQFIMPLLGYAVLSLLQELFAVIKSLVPWIALILLVFIGIRMIHEGLTGSEEKNGPDSSSPISFALLFFQGVATSLDALSVGLTLTEYDINAAVAASLIIAVVTFFLCMTGIFIGRRLGMYLAGKAPILGGAILIFIGLKIFLEGLGILII